MVWYENFHDLIWQKVWYAKELDDSLSDLVWNIYDLIWQKFDL